MQLEERVAGQLRCLPDPGRHELIVELVVLVDVEVARVWVLGLDGRGVDAATPRGGKSP